MERVAKAMKTIITHHLGENTPDWVVDKIERIVDHIVADRLSSVLGENVRLSVVEIKVLEGHAQGLTAAQIADKVHLTKRTIDGINYRIRKKMKCKSTTHCVAVAVSMGIVKI